MGSAAIPLVYDLAELCRLAETSDFIGSAAECDRVHVDSIDGLQIVADNFRSTGVRCLFLRIRCATADRVHLALAGECGIASCPSGGWLLTSPTAMRPDVLDPDAAKTASP